jgi:hypothetical protein
LSKAFDQFVARKTHEAVAASLPPYVTALDAPDPQSPAIGSEWTHSLFDGSFLASRKVTGKLVLVVHQ